MKVVVSAGGTGGHIYPALAIIDKIKQKYPESEFLYIGTHNRMEKDIVPKKGIPFESIEIYGLERKKIWKNFKTFSCFIKSQKKIKKLLKDFKPDVVIGVGGYVTGPVIKVAHKLGIKTIIHEQNSIAGKANLYLSRYVDKICVSFVASAKAFPKEKVVFTGNPVSELAIKAKSLDKTTLGFKKEKKLVVFVMGSLGSSLVNDVLLKTLKNKTNNEYEVLWITGKNYYPKVQNEKFDKSIKVLPYLDDMVRILKETDLLVTRAGASTLSEIITLKIPSILIPSPYVANNHQYKNADDLVSKKAALLLEEKDLTDESLLIMIDEVLNSKTTMLDMKENLKQFQVQNSATAILKVIEEVIKK